MGRFGDGLLSRAAKNPKAEMPFLDHLEELRGRILWCVLAVGICSVAGLLIVYYLNVTEFLVRPGQEVFGEDEWTLIYLAPADPFFIFLKISLTIGLVLASPVVIYQIWVFLSPALEKHEKRAIVPSLFLGLVLFAVGVAMAYFLALPLSLRFLTGILTDFMEPNYRATDYLGFVVKLLLGFGIVFELPVVVLILSALGLITPAFLRSKRRHAIVVNLILAAALSPGDVLVVTFLMLFPLILLFEFSILMSVLVWRGRRKRDEGAEDAKRADRTEPAGPVDPPENAVASPYTHGDPSRDDG